MYGEGIHKDYFITMVYVDQRQEDYVRLWYGHISGSL